MFGRNYCYLKQKKSINSSCPLNKQSRIVCIFYTTCIVQLNEKHAYDSKQGFKREELLAYQALYFFTMTEAL